MDISFYIPRGCYYLVQDGGTPYWSISNISLLSPSWINAVNISTAENVVPLPCFNGIKIAAIIGDDFGSAHISGRALLGANAASNFEGSFISSAQNARASSSFGPITISSKGGAFYRMLLTGFGATGFIDEEKNILGFQLSGMIL